MNIFSEQVFGQLFLVNKYNFALINKLNVNINENKKKEKSCTQNLKTNSTTHNELERKIELFYFISLLCILLLYLLIAKNETGQWTFIYVIIKLNTNDINSVILLIFFCSSLYFLHIYEALKWIGCSYMILVS